MSMSVYMLIDSIEWLKDYNEDDYPFFEILGYYPVVSFRYFINEESEVFDVIGTLNTEYLSPELEDNFTNEVSKGSIVKVEGNLVESFLCKSFEVVTLETKPKVPEKIKKRLEEIKRGEVF